MALELLAGPFPLTVNGVNVRFRDTPFYLDEYGIVGESSWYCIHQLDGVGYQRNNYINNGHDGALSYDEVRDSLLMAPTVYSSSYALFNPLICRRPVASFMTIGHRVPLTRLKDRYIFCRPYYPWGSPARYQMYQANTNGSSTAEYDFVGPTATGNSIAVISPAGGSIYCVAFGDAGLIFFYDTKLKTQVGSYKRIGMECRWLWYSKRFNIFISVHRVVDGSGAHTHDELRIWANETRPVTVSAPIALQPIEKGRTSTIQVQILGGSGDPVSGTLVDWTATTGVLAKAQTRTDDWGYAEVEYTAPLSTGSVDITATVTY